jgi:hypothetical protein
MAEAQPIIAPDATRVGQAFELGGAPFGVSLFKGWGFCPFPEIPDGCRSLRFFKGCGDGGQTGRFLTRAKL